MKRKKLPKIVNIICSVTGIVFAAKLLGFVKQMATASTFGTTIETDIISIAQGIINDIDYLLVQAFITAFIPIYISAKAKDKNSANEFVSNVLVVWTSISVIISLIIVALAGFFPRIIAPSYNGEKAQRLVIYIRIYAITIVLIVWIAVFSSILKSHEKFIANEIVSINNSVSVLICIIVLSGVLGVNSLVVGYYGYAILSVSYLFLMSRKLWSWRPQNPLKDANVKQLVKMMIPLLFGYAMVFINQQVDRAIVSGLGEGVVTSINYAAVLTNFIDTMTGSICAVAFTYVSKFVAENNDKKAGQIIRSAICLFSLALVPICIVVVLSSRDIVTVVYGRGRFNSESINNTSYALVGYAISMVFFSYRELFTRLQYSYKESKLPVINSFIGIVVNIVLSILLSRIYGVFGVALATSIATIICSVLNMYSARRLNKYLLFSDVLKYMPFWLLGGGMSLLVAFVAKAEMAGISVYLRLIYITLIVFAVYFLFIYSILKKLIGEFKLILAE